MLEGKSTASQESLWRADPGPREVRGRQGEPLRSSPQNRLHDPRNREPV
jgi:hypothetical protein